MQGKLRSTRSRPESANELGACGCLTGAGPVRAHARSRGFCRLRANPAPAKRRTGTITPMSVLIVYCTCPDAASASSIAQMLVSEHLAACVSELPGLRSTYSWQGRIERDEETLLIIKTTRERLSALTERITALHPADLPEILATETAGGLSAYLDWVAEQTHAHD